MKIEEFLNSMNATDTSALMDVANQVTANVDLEKVDALMSVGFYAWLWIG